MFRFSILFFFLLSILLGNPLNVTSPGNVLSLSFSLKDGKPEYTVKRLGKTIVQPSALGFTLERQNNLDANFELAGFESTEFSETWDQVWGEKRQILNAYGELRVDLIQRESNYKLTIVFRTYDDGYAFRYIIPEQNGLDRFDISDELSEFHLADDYHAWWIKAYQWNRYEYLYQHSPLSKVDTAHTPITMESKDGLFISIHEAALTDFASMTIANLGDNRLKADLVPWSDGIKVKTQTPMRSPWRTMQVADNAGDLIDSYLILNLNEPNKIADTGWIRPGKYVGIWWEMHLGISTWGSGDKHGATTANARRYIDFAAANGFDGVLVEGWNQGWDGNWIKNGDKFSFTEPYPDFDLAGVAKYAIENGVRLIGHHETAGGIYNYEKQMEDAYALYQRLGVNTIKTGYVSHATEIQRIDENGVKQGEWHHGQFMVRHYRKAVETAARYGIMLDVHEPIKATGIRRTWPNMMTREGARGQEFNAWGGNWGNPPDHTLIIPFTRCLGGPFDYTPGIFDLLFEEAKPNNRVNATLTKELAHYVTIYSPLHMAADLPENYSKHRDAFQFIKAVPTDWEDTKVLHARIGDFLTIARQKRNSEEWYIGSITDENGRVLKASLSFLQPGKTYKAIIYRDKADGHWQTNPYAYEIIEMDVDNTTILTLRLAPGGGTAIQIIPR
jgi:alpha-glucosidase